MKKDKITIMFSRLFPTTHSRRGEPTRFIEQVMLGDKIHTIRRQYDKWRVLADKTHARRYDISLCQWAATPRRSKHHQVGLLDGRIGVQRIQLLYFADTDNIIATVDGNIDVAIETLAANDGLSVDDFKEWFFGKNRREYGNNEYNGCIIHFTDFRYS
ncbi:MAG: hypothetical protein NC401_10460 [Ruminococcus sp.]|nr:hypothetical protein [Ruminococcus sp.]